MRKLVFVLPLLLIGCGRLEREIAGLTGGVAYIQFTSGVTVKYNTDGTIATC